MSDRTCPDCGADISDRHHNAKRCPPCSRSRQAQQQGLGSRTKPCSVDNGECSPGRLKSGMCELHYRRVRQTGSPTLSVRDQLAQHEVSERGCWLWTGPMYRNGYGSIGEATYGTGMAHRAMYEDRIGPIPAGLDLDHLCRNRRCVNPTHLEPVTRAVNIQRGVAARMGAMCGKGHDQTADNARWTEPSTGRSYCRKCKAAREKAGHERRKAG